MNKIVLIGYGLIGRVHADIVERNPNAELCAIIVPTLGLEKYKQDHRRALLTDERLEVILNDLQPDGVIIASPTAAHLSQLLTCLRLNVPTLVEKPAVKSTDEFWRHCDDEIYANLNSAKCLVGHHRISGSIYRNAKTAIDSGAIGIVRTICGLTAWRKPDAYFEDGPWRVKADECGGVLGINFIHEVATLISLLGPICEVFAVGQKVRGFEVWDSISITLRFRTGCTASWSISDNVVGDRSWEHNSGESAAFPQTPHSSIFICGSHGTLELPGLVLVQQNHDDLDWWKPTTRVKLDTKLPNDPLESQFAEFLSLIAGEESQGVGLLQGLLFLRVIECLEKSLEQNKPVKIENERYV